ncbi:MAG: hypothetical protein V8S31_09860 [Lachnospiraceae bacterium]
MNHTEVTEKNDNIKIRLVVYLIGLFIMTLGISMSVKSNLGVSPVSSIPYTITCITGLEMGKATILFHIVLVALQFVILRGAFQIKKSAASLLKRSCRFLVSLMIARTLASSSQITRSLHAASIFNIGESQSGKYFSSKTLRTGAWFNMFLVQPCR